MGGGDEQMRLPLTYWMEPPGGHPTKAISPVGRRPMRVEQTGVAQAFWWSDGVKGWELAEGARPRWGRRCAG